MEYNFDEIVDRRGLDSKKWEENKLMFGTDDVLPMWVADIDFKSPQPLIDALEERVEHGVFGYSFRDDDAYQAMIDWASRRYDWEIDKDWIVFNPGVVMGLNLGVLELTKPGEKIIVQTPVYPPFIGVIEKNKRKIIKNPLVDNGEKFVMDLEDLESRIDEDTRLMMLCHPHNPVGRAWTDGELESLGKLCLDNDIFIVSDEIHADFTFGSKHRPLATLSKRLEENTVTLMSPSKTFNIAGLGHSVAIIPNKEIRDKYKAAIDLMGIGSVDIFGNIGFKVAYNEGEEWLDELLPYLESNIDYALDYIEKNIPEIRVYKPEATYLLWMDFSGFNKSADEVQDALIHEGKIGLNDGRPYGDNGDNYFRLNIGCPRSILEEGLARIGRAAESLR